MYDPDLKRGIRKKYLPEPNPQKVELPRCAWLHDILEKAKQLYFNDVEGESASLTLAHSTGILIPVEDEEKWSLGKRIPFSQVVSNSMLPY